MIPYGGGTSVVGHINPLPADAPVLTIDLSQLNRLIELDETSHLATFGAGVRGPELEKQLNAKGYTLGHFPQSFELSTLGGWIATRSSGQQSYHYGRIEDLFAGGGPRRPAARWSCRRCLPAPPAPTCASLLLGSEGRLGIITQATVRIRHMPEFEAFYGVFFPDWERGVEAVRQIAQEGVGLSMLRLSNARETETTLALSGKERLVRWADRGLGILGYGAGTLPAGLRRHRECRVCPPGASPGAEHYPGAWRAKHRRDHWQALAQIALSDPLPAQRAVGAEVTLWTRWKPRFPGGR